jgi:hypothetical protein
VRGGDIERMETVAIRDVVPLERDLHEDTFVLRGRNQACSEPSFGTKSRRSEYTCARIDDLDFRFVRLRDRRFHDYDRDAGLRPDDGIRQFPVRYGKGTYDSAVRSRADVETSPGSQAAQRAGPRQAGDFGAVGAPGDLPNRRSDEGQLRAGVAVDEPAAAGLIIGLGDEEASTGRGRPDDVLAGGRVGANNDGCQGGKSQEHGHECCAQNADRATGPPATGRLAATRCQPRGGDIKRQQENGNDRAEVGTSDSCEDEEAQSRGQHDGKRRQRRTQQNRRQRGRQQRGRDQAPT